LTLLCSKAWRRANGERTAFDTGFETHEDPLFLSAASIVEIKAAIRRIPRPDERVRPPLI